MVAAVLDVEDDGNSTLQPPSAFNFAKPDEWPRWIRWFDQYRLASGLSTASDERQISTLLYRLGQDADATLRSTNISEDQRKKYDEVHKGFDTFFNVRKNVIFERARFNRRDQQEGESIEQYIVSLYHLVEDCQYGTMKEEMIRDSLVVGIRDSALSQKLQMDPSLTLESAKRIVRQREAVQEHHHLLREGDSRSNPLMVEGMQKRPFQGPRRKGGSSANSKNKSKQKSCTRCGKGVHEECPAKDAKCHKCERKGHYAAQCFTKTKVSELEVEEDLENHLDSVFLDTVVKENRVVWTADILLGQQAVEFKIDTGAEVTAISQETFCSLQKKESLRKFSKALYGPGNKRLTVLGQFNATLQYKQRSTQQEVFVVKGLKNDLLGLPAFI